MSQQFRQAVEAGNHAGMLAALTDDVVLHSPVAFHPFRGKDQVSVLFNVLLTTFEDFRYTDEIIGEGVTVLVFRARIGNREIEGVDLMREGPDGRINDFTVMVRPLSAAIALAEGAGPKITRPTSFT